MSSHSSAVARAGTSGRDETDPAALRLTVERTRAELAETVEGLFYALDVPARAKDRVEDTKTRLRTRAGELVVQVRTQAQELTGRATTQGRDLAAKTTAQARDLTAKTTAQARDLTAKATAQSQDLTGKATAQAGQLRGRTAQAWQERPVAVAGVAALATGVVLSIVVASLRDDQ